MDILKVFLIPEQEPKKSKSKDSQLSEYKEVVHEKDVILRNHLAKINELEHELAELKLKQAKMDYAIRATDLDENELTKIIISYDTVVQKLLEERQRLFAEKSELEDHIINLEGRFKQLLDQYENTKEIMTGVMQRENISNEQIGECKKNIMDLKSEYELLVNDTHSKLKEMKNQMVKDNESLRQVLNSKFNNTELVKASTESVQDDSFVLVP